MKIFEKVRNGNKRKIYFCGLKIASYSKAPSLYSEIVELKKQILLLYSSQHTIQDNLNTLKENIQNIQSEIKKQNISLVQEENRITGSKLPDWKNILNITPYTGDNLETSRYANIYKKQEKFISHKWEHYLPIYNKLLEKTVTQNQPITLLEIGVQNGGSLEVWKDFLPAHSNIYGIDINEKCALIPFSENIVFFQGSASDATLIDKNFKNIQFDVIVDDGSHISSDVIKSFELLWDHLNYEGLYIIEDCHTAYWTEFEGGFRYKHSYIEYFKRLIDAVNFKYILPKEYKNNEYEIRFLEKLNKEIAAIYFYDSVIVIEKYVSKKSSNFRTYTTRGEALVYDFDNDKNVIECDETTKFEKFYRD